MDYESKAIEKTKASYLATATVDLTTGKRKFDMLDTITENNSQMEVKATLFEKYGQVISKMPENTGDYDQDDTQPTSDKIRGTNVLDSFASRTTQNARVPLNEPATIITSTDDTTDELNSVQVVTGANFSGKSVYLKQIALIVYMAHIGR